jgi:lysophospholipase L1-like esterase
MKRRATWLGRFGLLFVSLLCLEGLACVYVAKLATPERRRQFSVYENLPESERRVIPHPYMVYANAPHYERGAKTHNALGWRGPETTLAKPEGVFRILILGGSTTYTEAVSDNVDTFPEQLQRLLRETYQHTNIEVINGGVPGYNSWESLVNLCFRGIAMEPDLVIVHHGANDVHCRFVRPGAYHSDNRGRRQAWQWKELSWAEEHLTLYRILKRLKKGTHIGLEPFVDSPTLVGPYSDYEEPELAFEKLLEEHRPIHFQTNLRNMAAICQEHGASMLLTTWAWCPDFEKDYAGFDFYQRGFREMNEVVLALAKERGWECFDFAAKMSQVKALWADGRHVNAQGALEKASLFADYLAESGLLP